MYESQCWVCVCAQVYQKAQREIRIYISVLGECECVHTYIKELSERYTHKYQRDQQENSERVPGRKSPWHFPCPVMCLWEKAQRERKRGRQAKGIVKWTHPRTICPGIEMGNIKAHDPRQGTIFAAAETCGASFRGEIPRSAESIAGGKSWFSCTWQIISKVSSIVAL